MRRVIKHTGYLLGENRVGPGYIMQIEKICEKVIFKFRSGGQGGVSHTQSSTDLDSYQEFKFGKG